jgi:hypothetical protein
MGQHSLPLHFNHDEEAIITSEETGNLQRPWQAH